jgi:hypothetical protein
MTQQPHDGEHQPGGDPDSGPVSRGRRPARQRVSIPSVDQILQQLIQLNGAVAIGAMSTKEANLIHKNLRTVLEVQMKRASREDTGPSQEALIDLCRNDPRVLNVMEPFLTDAQMDWIMNEVTGDEDGSV